MGSTKSHFPIDPSLLNLGAGRDFGILSSLFLPAVRAPLFCFPAEWSSSFCWNNPWQRAQWMAEQLSFLEVVMNFLVLSHILESHGHLDVSSWSCLHLPRGRKVNTYYAPTICTQSVRILTVHYPSWPSNNYRSNNWVTRRPSVPVPSRFVVFHYIILMLKIGLPSST